MLIRFCIIFIVFLLTMNFAFAKIVDVNNEQIIELSKTNIPIIISGGVSSEKDIIEIKKRANDKILGVISGRAIYDNRLNVHDCNKILGN